MSTWLDGIDISTYQGSVDYDALKKSGIKFVYAKATEGVSYADDQFARNHDEARANGIEFGAYHFLRFGSDPIAQAEHFLSVTQGKSRLGTLLPMVDVEGGGQDSVHDLSVLTGKLAAFNARIERELGGKRIVIYSDYGDWNGMMKGTSAFAGHPFWVAEYNNDAAPTLPRGQTAWCIWQYTDAAHVPGIAGNVDGDRLPHGVDLSHLKR